MKPSVVIASVAFALVVIAAKPLAQSIDPLATARARNALIADGVKKADAIQIASVYAEDAEFTEPGDRVRMRDGIRRMWQEQLGKGLAAAEFTTTDATIANGVIEEKGTFVFKTKSGAVIASGSYVNTWRRTGNAWLLKTNTVTPKARRY